MLDNFPIFLWPVHPTSLMQRRHDVRNLVLAYGRNSTSYQLVNPGIGHWFSRDGYACAGYVDVGSIRVVAGAPVCTPARMDQVTREFLADLKQAGKEAIFFAAIDPLIDALESAGPLTAVQLGAQPCWNLAEWESAVKSHRSLREQFRRARAKGVKIREVPTDEAENNPALRRVLETWLQSKPLPPLHFLVEPHTLSNLTDRRTFVAEFRGEPVAFLNLCPIPLLKGWLTEQFPRLPDAPNGAVELMIHHAAQQMAREGYEYFTMGLSPLAHRAGEYRMPGWMRPITAWAKAHGRRFYNFDGLEQFKSKFEPGWWEPIYAVVPEPEFRPRHLLAITRAFTRQPVWLALVKGLGRAIKQEVRWLVR